MSCPEPGKPVCAGKVPIGLELDPGTYWWCACGRSKQQPFCDGSHKGCGIVPRKVEVSERRKLWFCACKLTATAPFCDGSHKKA